ncbi:MAG: hypothetical protein IT211_11985 [Armatimonadetes bacterium]|nr:hypothetical protein [Armatimonadota bacterium]
MSDNPKLRWRNPLGLGVLWVRHQPKSTNSWIYMRIGNKQPRSTGVRWPEDDGAKVSKIGSLRVSKDQRWAYDTAMQLLQSWAQQYINPTTDDDFRPQKRTTLHAAIKQFEAEIKIDTIPKDIRSRYRQAWKNYLTGGKDVYGVPFDDIPVTYKGLKDRIKAKKEVCTLAQANAKKVQYKLHNFTRWLVREEMLDRDPMDVIGIDRGYNDPESDTIVDTPEEVARQVKWLEEARYYELADYVRITFMMGLRSGDALRMKASHYAKVAGGATVMVIHSKKTKINKLGLRHFPIHRPNQPELIPGLTDLIERLVRNADAEGWLFPWRSGTKIRLKLKECRDALGLLRTEAGHTKTSKCWRASANVLWRDGYGWHEDLRKKLLGHSAKVNAAHYSTTQAAPDALREIERIIERTK